MTYRYKRTEPTLWTVGTDVDGKWEPESDHGSPEEAADRVRWLNGGQDATPTLADDLLERIETAEQERDRLAAELEEVRHHLAKAISARQDAEQRLAAVTRERDEARVIAYEYRRVERGNFLLYIHTCGQAEWFDAAPSDGGCEACESGSDNPADWTLLYTKINSDEASGLGSPRRAQDGWPTAEELAIRWHNTYEQQIGLKPEGRMPWRDMRPEYREAVVGTCRVLRAWLHDQIVGRLPVVAPSQGQDIPADQLDALSDGITTSGLPIFDATIGALRQAYRIGFAAALGYEITLDEGGRVGVGDRPEPAAPDHEAEYDALAELAARFDRLAAQHGKCAAALDQAERDLLNERAEHRQTSAAEDEARERAEQLLAALTTARRALKALDAHSRYGVRLTIAGPSTWEGALTVLGFVTERTAREVGRLFSDSLAARVFTRVDATLIEPAKLGDPPAVDVQALLEETRAALAAADSNQDRTDIVEELLEDWYAAWPDTALTSPHQAIAGELVRLLQPGPVTLTIPSDLWAGLAQRIRAGHSEAPS
jgi:hypothetical protein